jgi:uridine phosphorylase
VLEKQALPILEYDANRAAVIEPDRDGPGVVLPSRCVMTFFADVADKYAAQEGCTVAGSTRWESGTFCVYQMEHKGVPVCFVHAHVGAPIVAGISEFLIAHGVRSVVACGGCGVIAPIPQGAILVPVSAIRDEGTSYHYLPPAREIALAPHAVSAIEQACAANGVRFTETKTWTTDAFFRETAGKVELRRSEGCQCVDMECSALAAVAEFRGITFGALFYSGDILATDGYEERDWWNDKSSREKLFLLALDAVVLL